MGDLRRVGVLGGMGPQATVLLQQRLVAAVGAEDDRSHLPLLIDMNPQVPSRIAWLLEGGDEDPGPVLAGMARGLEAAGVDALAMPCNTAHHFAGAIRQAVDIPLLDMVELTAARLEETLPPGAPVGILGSPALERSGLFEEAFTRHGLTALYPPDPDALLGAIRRIKAQGVTAADRTALGEGAHALEHLGARCLLVACSEFSLLADALAGRLPVVDSLDVLVEAIVAFSRGRGTGAVASRRAADLGDR